MGLTVEGVDRNRTWDRITDLKKKGAEYVERTKQKIAEQLTVRKPQGSAEPRKKDREVGLPAARQELDARLDEKTPEPTPKKTTGAQAALDSVRVDQQSVRDVRGEQSATELDLMEETKGKVDATFARAQGKLPHGAEVTDASDDRVEIVRKDQQGRVLWREIAERDGDRMHWERTDFRDGRADRKTLETGGDDATIARQESWAEKPSEAPSSPSTEELAERWDDDESVRIDEISFSHDDDDLVTQRVNFGADTKSQTETRYRTQQGSDGIHDTVAEDFDDEADTDVVETTTLSQQRGEDLEESKQTTYAQGNLRATSVEQPDQPKQWMLEKQEGNRYRSQTFVENAPDFSTIVDRTAEGNQIHETMRSTGLDEDGEPVHSQSTTDTELDDQGLVAKKRIESIDEAGIHTFQHYDRQTERTERGLQVTEKVGTRREEPGDPPQVFTSDRELRSLENAGSRRILSTRETLTSPDGTATSVIDDRGPRLTVNGKAVPVKENSEQLAKLGEGELDLAAHTTADTFHDVKRYAAAGGAALRLISIGAGVPDASYDSKLSVQSQQRVNTQLESFNQKLTERFGSSRMANVFRAQSLGQAGAKTIGGIAGLVAAGSALLDDTHDLNWNKAQVTLDVSNAGVSGSQSVAAAKEVQAIKAGSTVDEAAEAAGKLGTFARWGGLATGVAAGGLEIFSGVKTDDKVKVAQGGVTIAGAVGACAAVGMIGGPLGIVAGAGIGLAAFGVHWAIGELFGGDPEVAEKKI